MFEKCVSACPQKTPNIRARWFSQTTPDEHSLTPPPCRWPALITLRTPKFHSSFGAASVMMYVLFRSFCLFERHPYAYVCHPRIGVVVNIICIRIFCDHINALHIFDQTWYRYELRLSSRMGPPHHYSSSLSPSHPPMPPPSRWLALTTLPPVAKFQHVWRRLLFKLCCFPPPSLVRNICLCCLV